MAFKRCFEDDENVYILLELCAPRTLSDVSKDGGPLPQEATGEEPSNDWFDTPMMQRLYSGYSMQDNLRGWSRFGRVAFTQPVPAPFKLRSIRYEIAYG